MERIVRTYVESPSGDARRCLAFDLEKFVSFNIDTRVLQLTSGVHVVCKDCVERLIQAYRLLDEEYEYFYDVPADADVTIKHWWEFWK